MTILKLHFLDLVLVSAMSYLSYDLITHSLEYASCYHPINYWLLIVYVILVVIRFALNIVQNSDFHFLVKVFRFYLTCIVIPFLLEWTIQGTIWYVNIEIYTPFCIPPSRLPYLIIWWLTVCYIILILLIGVMIYEIVSVIKQRRSYLTIQIYLNRVNPYQNLPELNNLFEESNLKSEDVPLTESEIKMLKRGRIKVNDTDEDCSICFDSFEEKKNLCIRFFICKHIFHEKCIEEWLHKKPLCPNCKRDIRNDLIAMVRSRNRKKEEISCDYKNLEEEKLD